MGLMVKLGSTKYSCFYVTIKVVLVLVITRILFIRSGSCFYVF